MASERPRSRLKPRTWSLLAAAGLGLVVIGFLRGVFLTLLVAVVLAYILDPIVTWLARTRLGGAHRSRGLAVVVLYVVLLGSVAVTGRMAVPRLASEVAVLAAEAPIAFQRARQEWIPRIEREIRTRLRPYLPAVAEPGAAVAAEGVRVRTTSDGALDLSLGGLELEVEQVGEGRYRIRTAPPAQPFDVAGALGEAARGVVKTGQGDTMTVLSLGRRIVAGALAAVFGTMVTLMIAAYLLADKERVFAFVRVLFPPRLRADWEMLLVKMERGLAGVLRGQLVICVVNGVLSGIGFSLLDLPYWPLLTVVAALLSIIPVFGAIISSIPAIAFGLTVSWQVAFFTLLWILGIHALEAYVLNPKILGTAARIHPVFVLCALVAGERSYGIVGALLAVPFASILQTLFVYLRNRAYHEETEPPPVSYDGEGRESDPGTRESLA